jgi:hypothetical protein
MNDITPFPLFSVGQIIEVVSRTWAGINKLGGTARILSINQNGLSYDIKYVLTSTREKDVQATFIKPLEEFTKEKRRRISGKKNFEQFNFVLFLFVITVNDFAF